MRGFTRTVALWLERRAFWRDFKHGLINLVITYSGRDRGGQWAEVAWCFSLWLRREHNAGQWSGECRRQRRWLRGGWQESGIGEVTKVWTCETGDYISPASPCARESLFPTIGTWASGMCLRKFLEKKEEDFLWRAPCSIGYSLGAVLRRPRCHSYVPHACLYARTSAVLLFGYQEWNTQVTQMFSFFFPAPTPFPFFSPEV